MANDLIRDFLKHQKRYLKRAKTEKWQNRKRKIILDFLFYSKKILGKRKIRELTKEDIQNYLKTKSKSIKKTTLANYKSIIGEFFKRANLID